MFEKYLQCPYCREAISIFLNTRIVGFINIVVDCKVCCKPIDIDYCVEDGDITAFSYNSIEGNES